MFKYNWFMWPPVAMTVWRLLLCGSLCLITGITGQSENAIGAHRVFEKTSFSCSGRPAGYYADVETGCQVYHMCDGLGRQFSYSCPNTTLFQQRMLICDHWYMVNCSKAESHYAANLLIGQRDKPFVDDEENNLRTPRPDLLDRPYAPDYSGESFRSQYKQFSPNQNKIQDKDKATEKKTDKPAANAAAAAHNGHNVPGQQSWKIPPPSRVFQPPAYEPQGVDSNGANANGKKPTSSPVSVRTIKTTPRTTTRVRGTSTYVSTTHSPATTTTRRVTSPPPTQAATTRRQYQSPTTSPPYNNAPLLQRRQETAVHDDLGTSHSTRYNTSADFNSASDEYSDKPYKHTQTFKTTKTQTASSASVSAKKTNVKLPSKLFEPPFLYPIYNQEDNKIQTAVNVPHPLLRTSTATPFSAPYTARTTPSPTTASPTLSPATRQPISRPTTLAGKPFSVSKYATSTATPAATASGGSNINNFRFETQKPTKEVRSTPTPAHGFKPPTPRPPPTNNVRQTVRPPPASQQVEASPFDYKVPTKTNAQSAPHSTGSLSKASQQPANDLLPPYQDFVQHDVATTQGPPIYYEWKVPSNGLEPPRLEAPYGVDGREYPDTVIDYNTISESGGFTPLLSPSTSFGIDQAKQRTSNRDHLAANKQQQIEEATTRKPASRSIKETGQPNSLKRGATAGKSNSTAAAVTAKTTNRQRGAAQAGAASESAADIQQLRLDLSVPEYAFPLENIGRTGYLATDIYNSFQLKIPERRSDADEHQHWFGENPECPECHPSYVVPGTCEPCLRR